MPGQLDFVLRATSDCMCTICMSLCCSIVNYGGIRDIPRNPASNKVPETRDTALEQRLGPANLPHCDYPKLPPPIQRIGAEINDSIFLEHYTGLYNSWRGRKRKGSHENPIGDISYERHIRLACQADNPINYKLRIPADISPSLKFAKNLTDSEYQELRKTNPNHLRSLQTTPQKEKVRWGPLAPRIYGIPHGGLTPPLCIFIAPHEVPRIPEDRAANSRLPTLGDLNATGGYPLKVAPRISRNLTHLSSLKNTLLDSETRYRKRTKGGENNIRSNYGTRLWGKNKSPP